MDIPTTPPGATAEERARIHAEHFAAIVQKRTEERRPQQDAHVEAYRSIMRQLEFANELAARFGRLPVTVEQLLAPRPTQEPRDPEAAYKEALERRKATFEKLCPAEYRKPWEWELVKPEVDHAEARRVLEWEFGARGLYVAGASGHSKTRAVCQLMRRLIIQEKRTVQFLDGIAFSNLCTRAFGEPATTEATFRPLITCDVLIIDDLAKRWTPATEEGAFMVLDRRTANMRPVLVTLNYTADDLYAMQQARGDLAAVRDVVTPLIRRLVDYCEPVVF